ncbi:MAG: DEAD/DEAH box helicase family protein [Candidatus Cloacimonadales bacterium]|nr:DEAD/DEAH box helicase family protein [Candidatus Cloacimonadales bacterium]
MLNQIIKQKKDYWLQSNDCTIKDIIKYIRKTGDLREAQIEAIEIYLFLKIKGNNEPLWKLFAEGFFTNGTDLAKLNINQNAREYLQQNLAAQALFDFSRQKIGGTTLLPELEKLIIQQPENIEYERIIKNIFYNVDYADYLMSLPMGAGKTYLMAAFIYLDLYFALNEPENKNFSHNFLILIPSGLKSSIIPSLKTIEHFDPTWVLPEPAASKIKQLRKFEVLDQPKSARQSTTARNPNAQKVNQCLRDPFGYIFVVNAEKVILDRIEITDQLEVIEKTEDQKDIFANELRHLIGKIPNLSIFIDEVHHAANDEIKLRKVVTNWNAKGNVTTVLGFTGTPYLKTADQIKVTDGSFFKFRQITNTVYYYPLITAIRYFLKKPQVKFATELNRNQIIERGISDFNEIYKEKVYENRTVAKLAIYCGNIKTLEEEVYPFLVGTLKINPDKILKFHGGNKEYKLPKENELLFSSLDIPQTKAGTKIRYILLVQIGKEGWDCRSLTGIILSQKGDSPENMVLQTSCRCLRQVDKNKNETALIWLNEFNAKILNSQLQAEQNTNIEEINKIGGKPEVETVERFSRIEHLQLPKVEFYQLKVTYQAIEEEDDPNTKKKLKLLLENLENYKTTALIKTSEIDQIDHAVISMISQIGSNNANFNKWLFEISKQSFNNLSIRDLMEYQTPLKNIFLKICYSQNGNLLFNDVYDFYSINSKIRLAFSIKRELQTESEVIPKEANLLIVDKIKPVEKNEKLYPDENAVRQILEYEEVSSDIESLETELEKKNEQALKSLTEQGLGNFFVPKNLLPEVKNKDKTFHYLPYNFVQSNFEKELLINALRLTSFKESKLEIYYNGERGLTDFVINCFAKNGKYWKNIGKYTTDFLIIKRQEKAIHQVLMIETKGKGYENDPVFLKKKNYVSNEFLKQNNEKFGYNKFDFLYLSDADKIENNISKLNEKISNFF